MKILINKYINTEKTHSLLQSGVYVFKVAQNATKFLVKKELESMFDIKVSKVRLLKRMSKKVTFKGTSGVKSCFKKAVITLKSGSIPVGIDKSQES